jgi:hypothetical protein
VAFEQYNIVTFPKVVVIDQQGIVRYRWNDIDKGAADAALATLLRTPASTIAPTKEKETTALAIPAPDPHVQHAHP